MSNREETIIVNRVIRDDPSKGTMHNREPITPKLLWKSLKDYDLWPLYIIGLTFGTPMTTAKQYLTLTLKGLGFSTFVTNLLTIPTEFLSIVFLLILTYVSEVTEQLTLVSLIGQIWVLPFVVYLYVVDITAVNKWTVWAVMTLLLAYPNGELPSTVSYRKVANIPQHTPSKSVGILEIQTLSDLARSQLPCITCVSSPPESSLLTFTELVRHFFHFFHLNLRVLT
jgi:hypothetical protein